MQGIVTSVQRMWTEGRQRHGQAVDDIKTSAEAGQVIDLSVLQRALWPRQVHPKTLRCQQVVLLHSFLLSVPSPQKLQHCLRAQAEGKREEPSKQLWEAMNVFPAYQTRIAVLTEGNDVGVAAQKVRCLGTLQKLQPLAATPEGCPQHAS